ncbi:MAG: MFS transporter [Pirellulales bacterium]
MDDLPQESSPDSSAPGPPIVPPDGWPQDESGAPPENAYGVVKLPNFRRYLVGNFVGVLGMQMQTFALGYEIYERTESKLALGFVGLAQVAPVLALALVAGHVADHFSRKRVLMVCITCLGLVSAALTLISLEQAPVPLIYVCLTLNGVARAFLQPAKGSMLPLIVPRSQFAHAVTWHTGGFHMAAVVGPALGGWVVAVTHKPALVYVLDLLSSLFFLLMLARISIPTKAAASGALSWRTLAAGIEFLLRTRILLAAISLDMFAVLLGGAVALLPVYAKDILQVGPEGLGWMRAAPAIGALVTAFMIAHLPPMRKAGPILVWSVAGFGIATVVFGLSRSFGLSLAMLFLTGALDNVSVVIRHTLLQLSTPNEMRGRVAAVNGLFISSSNELGAFESGLVAELTTPTISVVSGGLGTIVVVAAIAWLAPELRKYGRLGS